jgi:soluble lytic murein transglycosylase-like protein
MTSLSNWRHEIEHAAERYGLDAVLLEALVQVESGGHPYAWNPEPRYRYLWDVRAWKPFRSLTPAEIASDRPPSDFPTLAGDRDQEWWGQRVSWGLCQVMGAVARELGFRGPYLPELVRAEISLDLGAKHLSHQMAWAGGNLRKGLGAYNAGRGGADGPVGQAYAAKVLARRDLILASEHP